MKVHVTRDRYGAHEWHVWVSLDETPTNEVETSHETFIIVGGATRDEVIERAYEMFAKAADICRNLDNWRRQRAHII
jgi:hypothetical protein